MINSRWVWRAVRRWGRPCHGRLDRGRCL